MDIDSLKRTFAKAKGNSLVVFLFFLLVSCSLWLSLTLNRIYETDISVSVQVENIPEGVTLENEGEIAMRVVVRGDGTDLFGHFFNDGIHLTADYAAFIRSGGGRMAMPVNAIRSKIIEQLGPSLTLKSFLTDSVATNVKRTTKVVPVRKNRIDLKAAEGYEIVSVKYVPDEVDITALIDEVAAVKEVMTPAVVCDGLECDTVIEMAFLPGKYIDVYPERVQVRVGVSKYVNRTIAVPVEYVNFPSDVNLGFLPLDVNVVYEVLEANEERVKTDDFSVSLRFDDYAYSVIVGAAGDLEKRFKVATTSPLVRNAKVVGVENVESADAGLNVDAL